MRFGAEMTQADIATELGISQMHVSRLLKQSLAHLRTGLLNSAPPTPGQDAPVLDTDPGPIASTRGVRPRAGPPPSGRCGGHAVS